MNTNYKKKSIFTSTSLCTTPTKSSILLCQTWAKPPIPATNIVKNIWQIKWRDGTTYQTTQDHSKYAVIANTAISKNFKFLYKNKFDSVFIGDINRMESQKKRGGGGFIFHNKNLWHAFHNIIINYHDIGINPHYNNIPIIPIIPIIPEIPDTFNTFDTYISK